MTHWRTNLLSHNFFFFNDTATTEIYTLSLHDALPISGRCARAGRADRCTGPASRAGRAAASGRAGRSEEHTSELQSRRDLVCRLLLEKKKKKACVASCRLQPGQPNKARTRHSSYV